MPEPQGRVPAGCSWTEPGVAWLADLGKGWKAGSVHVMRTVQSVRNVLEFGGVGCLRKTVGGWGFGGCDCHMATVGVCVCMYVEYVHTMRLSDYATD